MLKNIVNVSDLGFRAQLTGIIWTLSCSSCLFERNQPPIDHAVVIRTLHNLQFYHLDKNIVSV